MRGNPKFLEEFPRVVEKPAFSGVFTARLFQPGRRANWLASAQLSVGQSIDTLQLAIDALN
jgi:hypothetical protein